jgi:hypothetical protein
MLPRLRIMQLSFSMGNSIPTTSNNKTIPISANKFKTSMFKTRLNGEVYGLIAMPAKMYPITMGCFNLIEMTAINPDIIIIMAKSCNT